MSIIKLMALMIKKKLYRQKKCKKNIISKDIKFNITKDNNKTISKEYNKENNKKSIGLFFRK